jgi:hypothetical protein
VVLLCVAVICLGLYLAAALVPGTPPGYYVEVQNQGSGTVGGLAFVVGDRITRPGDSLIASGDTITLTVFAGQEDEVLTMRDASGRVYRIANGRGDVGELKVRIDIRGHEPSGALSGEIQVGEGGETLQLRAVEAGG